MRLHEIPIKSLPINNGNMLLANAINVHPVIVKIIGYLSVGILPNFSITVPANIDPIGNPTLYILAEIELCIYIITN